MSDPDDTPPFERPRSGIFKTPPPSPGPSRDTSPPRQSPQPNYPPAIPNEPKTDPRIMLERVYGEAKKAKRRRPINVAAALTTATTLFGGAGYGLHSYMDRQAKTEQQLDDHISREAEHHAEVTKRLDMQDRAARRQERGQATIKAMLELELDQHHVPRARRPVEDEPDSAGPPGETR